ncbi:hypothetical protein L1887_61844 [Cichorium endivia]|nr:hypothetical protein L1887_61844 [Cichorium endivia]
MMAPVCWHAAAVFLSVVLSLFIVEVASLPAGSPDSSWSAGSNFVPMDEDDSITSAHSRNGPSWHHSPSGQHEGLPQPWHHDPSDLHQPAWGVSGSAPVLPHQHDPAWVPAPTGPLDDLDHMILDHLLNDVSAAAPPSGQGSTARLLNHLAQAKPADILRQSGHREFPQGLRFGMPTANPSSEPRPDSPGQASSSGSPRSPQPENAGRLIPTEPAVNLLKIPETPPHLPPLATVGYSNTLFDTIRYHKLASFLPLRGTWGDSCTCFADKNVSSSSSLFMLMLGRADTSTLLNRFIGLTEWALGD